MDTETMIYIVAEYASKGDIFDHLVKTGKMSEPDACHVFAQILSAVKYCHTQGKFFRKSMKNLMKLRCQIPVFLNFAKKGPKKVVKSYKSN